MGFKVVWQIVDGGEATFELVYLKVELCERHGFLFVQEVNECPHVTCDLIEATEV
jgi:hypothetical protein